MYASPRSGRHIIQAPCLAPTLSFMAAPTPHHETQPLAHVLTDMDTSTPVGEWIVAEQKIPEAAFPTHPPFRSELRLTSTGSPQAGFEKRPSAVPAVPVLLRQGQWRAGAATWHFTSHSDPPGESLRGPSPLDGCFKLS